MSKLSLCEIQQSQLDKTPIVDGQLVCCLDTGNTYRDTDGKRVQIGSDLEIVNELPLAPIDGKIYCIGHGELWLFNSDWIRLNNDNFNINADANSANGEAKINLKLGDEVGSSVSVAGNGVTTVITDESGKLIVKTPDPNDIVNKITNSQIDTVVGNIATQNPDNYIHLDTSLTKSGYAADAAAVGNALKNKAPLNFGAANAGRYLIVGKNGNIVAGYKATSGDVVEITDWSSVQKIAASGEAAYHFAAGDIIENGWTDTALNKVYDNPLRVNHFSTETLSDGTSVPGMWLQTKYATPFGVPFSQYQAIMICDNGLSAGTYSFTFGETIGDYNFVNKGVSFHFTLTKDVPAGGRLAGLRGSWDNTTPYTSLKIYVYAEDRRTILETVGIAEGAAGTDLGTLTITGSETLNSIHRISYGDNCWSRSALRQYLNSDKTKGLWWEPQSKWDLAPDQLSSVDGYLCGVDKSLLEVIKPVKLQTYRNTVCYDDKQQGNTPDITYDKVTLPSIEQMNIVPQLAGEGAAQEYYIQLKGDGNKFSQWKTYPELITYGLENHTSVQCVRLRSASRGFGCSAWRVISSGYVSAYYAGNAWRCAPLVFIG